jgi:hypothetical protein
VSLNFPRVIITKFVSYCRPLGPGTQLCPGQDPRLDKRSQVILIISISSSANMYSRYVTTRLLIKLGKYFCCIVVNQHSKCCELTLSCDYVPMLVMRRNSKMFTICTLMLSPPNTCCDIAALYWLSQNQLEMNDLSNKLSVLLAICFDQPTTWLPRFNMNY